MGKKRQSTHTQMYLGACLITIEIPETGSLKDKRSVVKSLVERARRELRISVAEVGALDQWDVAEIGLAYVSNSSPHADEVIAKAVNWIENNLHEGYLADYQTQVVQVF